jgi:RHS repeat-associated protein
VYAGTKLFARADGVIGDTTAKKYWYHTDQVGSVKAVTNQTGVVVWKADYLPFGQQYMKNKLGLDFEEDDLGFTGKGYDADVGLYYFNARWYDADTGRFISEDPVADPNNPNLYTYGRNNPLKFNDPTGFISEGEQTALNHGVNPNPNTPITPDGVGAGYADFGLKSRLNPPTPPTVPGVEHTQTTTTDENGKKIIIDTYTNTAGNKITITTEVVGNIVTQKYEITSTDGKTVIKSGEISYPKGTENVNVLAVEGFVNEGKKYKAIAIVLDQEGALGAWQVSTFPNKNKFATIVEGKYKMTKSKHYSDYGPLYDSEAGKNYYWAIALEYNGKITTLMPNLNQPAIITNPYTQEKSYPLFATAIHIHSGFDQDFQGASNGSEGCQTIEPGTSSKNYPNGGNWNSFYDAAGGNYASEGDYTGNYYVTRL